MAAQPQRLGRRAQLPARTGERLALGLLVDAVSAVVDLLGVAGLLTRQATAPEACRLACEPAQIELAALLRLLDEGGEPSATPTVPLPAAVEQLHQRLMQAEQGAVGRMTLAELAATAEGQTCP